MCVCVDDVVRLRVEPCVCVDDVVRLRVEPCVCGCGQTDHEGGALCVWMWSD